MNFRLGTPDDIAAIRALQAANLYDNLTPAQREAGFVTTPFTEGQLLELVGQRGVFVAEGDGELLAYAMAADWAYWARWPIFPYMVSRLPLASLDGEPILAEQSFQYGPVCIAEPHRGRGILPRLFATLREAMAVRFPVGVTFVNRANPRSFAAHNRKLGMAVIDEFRFGGRDYWALAFATR